MLQMRQLCIFQSAKVIQLLRFYQIEQQSYHNLYFIMKVIILLLLIVFALSESCGGNCPSGKCPSCPCGTTRNVVDIATWCAKHNWNQACCKCIVSHESGGNAHAMNYNSNGTFDVGLWQINHVNWAGCNGGSAPCGTTENLNCAIKVYNGRGSWAPWSTHTACGC